MVDHLAILHPQSQKQQGRSSLALRQHRRICGVADLVPPVLLTASSLERVRHLFRSSGDSDSDSGRGVPAQSVPPDCVRSCPGAWPSEHAAGHLRFCFFKKSESVHLREHKSRLQSGQRWIHRGCLQRRRRISSSEKDDAFVDLYQNGRKMKWKAICSGELSHCKDSLFIRLVGFFSGRSVSKYVAYLQVMLTIIDLQHYCITFTFYLLQMLNYIYSELKKSAIT
ncbi:hypothetical protein CEXT_636471 [Caerostris extrusa]|uniref:Uncharacterized protein n=1 Tax=Caerostris extrusa TaxID=172846 RepID=A0AAV4NT86_CAEEX|nr:hypothetical protein CEXT_636471 [Caerostris extrusa]